MILLYKVVVVCVYDVEDGTIPLYVNVYITNSIRSDILIRDINDINFMQHTEMISDVFPH